MATTKNEKNTRAALTLELITAAPTGVTTDAIAAHLALTGTYRRQQAVAVATSLIAQGKVRQLDTNPVSYAPLALVAPAHEVAPPAAPVAEAAAEAVLADEEAPEATERLSKPALIALAVAKGLVKGVRAGRATPVAELRSLLGI